jgi:hypothetical protein
MLPLGDIPGGAVQPEGGRRGITGLQNRPRGPDKWLSADSRTAVHGAGSAVPGVLRGLSGAADGMAFVNQITAFSCGKGLRCA